MTKYQINYRLKHQRPICDCGRIATVYFSNSFICRRCFELDKERALEATTKKEKKPTDHCYSQRYKVATAYAKYCEAFHIIGTEKTRLPSSN